MMKLLEMLLTHRKTAIKCAKGLAVALLLLFSINTHIQNKKLTEGLEMAQNNIEAYQGSLAESWQANNVLKLDMKSLGQQNDKLLNQLDSVRKELKIKDKLLSTAATQTQIIYVNTSKPVEGNIIEILKDTTYTDSLKYNDLTTVKYTIGKDTVSIGLDVKNTQYLYIFTSRQYKNKKSFLKRLFTLDFKKVNKYRYEILNTNDLIKTSDVRVIESSEK